MRENDFLASFVRCNEVFTVRECNKIIALKAGVPCEDSPVGRDLIENKSVRNSSNYTLFRTPQNAWVYERLMQVTRQYNQNTQFQLQQIEALQLLEYRPGGFFTWHMDLGSAKHSTRKISLVVLLSNPSDYVGGELEFFSTEDQPKLKQGAGVWFPSYMLHQVKPVTQGLRYTLVSWVNGDAFQ